MYYRGQNCQGGPGGEIGPAVVCYAESPDGIHWNRPELELVEFEGSRQNNIVIGEEKYSHAFVPFKDANPDCTPDAKYKALAMARLGKPDPRRLLAFKSADGLRWEKMHDDCIIAKGTSDYAFDSQNVALWDTVRGEYRAYFRDWRSHRGKLWREIMGGLPAWACTITERDPLRCTVRPGMTTSCRW
jgi:hypothetical protein